MLTPDDYYGRGVEASVAGAGTYALYKSKRFHRVVVSSGTTADAVLPSALEMPTGAPLFILWNGSGVRDLVLKNSAGTTLVTIAAGQIAEIGCVYNGTAAGIWYRNVKAWLN